jgi:CheY-like chemotaxis protein
VAINFGLSIRQLRRQERIALETLVQVLSPQIEQSPATPNPLPNSFEEAGTNDENTLLTPENEYKWLETSQPDELINILELYQNALNALAPIIKDHLIEIENNPLPNFSPTILAQQASLQQGLVSMLSAAFALTHSSKLYTEINRDSTGISLSLQVDVMKPFSSEQEKIVLNSLTSAGDLVALSNAQLTYPQAIIPGEPFVIRLFLPETFKRKVFVVDDNADVLQLFERFFSNSQYLFTGCSVPKDAVSNAARIQPDLIYLDVMLPEIDGWELLGHFREHPETKSIPIVICTILPQESLALMLGAAAFLQKPFTRMDLLALSNRLTSGLAQVPE